jgi:hypothetical protein
LACSRLLSPAGAAAAAAPAALSRLTFDWLMLLRSGAWLILAWLLLSKSAVLIATRRSYKHIVVKLALLAVLDGSSSACAISGC